LENHKPIKNYQDFVNALLVAGFSLGGGNSEGIFSLIPWSWNEEPPYETPVRWHTGDAETDPWEWRIRVLAEHNDISYAKVFFKKSGYITRDWISHFVAARRGNTQFEDQYADGLLSHSAKRIYDVIQAHEVLPLHAIKQLAGFGKEEKSRFDSALVDLQMKLFLTMCGRQQKISRQGEEYGWSSTVFCTTENFWGQDVFEKAARLDQTTAIAEITEQVLRLNPAAEQKKILKFIKG